MVPSCPFTPFIPHVSPLHLRDHLVKCILVSRVLCDWLLVLLNLAQAWCALSCSCILSSIRGSSSCVKNFAVIFGSAVSVSDCFPGHCVARSRLPRKSCRCPRTCPKLLEIPVVRGQITTTRYARRLWCLQPRVPRRTKKVVRISLKDLITTPSDCCRARSQQRTLNSPKSQYAQGLWCLPQMLSSLQA